MALDWSALAGMKNRQHVYKRIKELITAETYGDGPDQWTVTELINENSNASSAARRAIEGVDDKGNVAGRGHMPGLDGAPFRVKLRVLSRQACYRDADGRPINYWDVTDDGEYSDGGEHCPSATDKPLPGDEVWVKGNPITHHPDEGHRLLKKDRMALHRREEARLGHECKPDIALFYWDKYPVDEDGCINATYLHAVQLLTTKGKRIVMPEFTTGARRKKDPMTKRLITNWQFEEVPPSTGNKPAPKRGAKG
jgi:hypothetical protein